MTERKEGAGFPIGYMRNFNDVEKNIIQRLVTNHNSGCSTVASFIYSAIIEKEVEQYINACEEIKTACCWELYEEQRIIEITFFLKWLEENRYIYFLPFRYPKIGEGEKCSEKIQFLDLPEEIKKLFERYGDSEMFVSSELKNLVENDFKTYEDLALDEARCQTKYSRITLLLSFIMLFISVITIFCNK